jgi:hypothetical protein
MNDKAFYVPDRWQVFLDDVMAQQSFFSKAKVEHSMQLLDYFNPWPRNSGSRFDDSYNLQPLVLMHNDLSLSVCLIF